ncbi:hypothetical protein CASFOL_034005 [Castilleja foliolosa]|uniref:Essential protein Yae1 N-terminal domain-containing protein n=1 Tax=Castilleja foliolosa TaxID=1961234 RepID=A0ABD3BZE5_9LAMI
MLVPSEVKTLHLFEARYIALLEEVERLEIGASVLIRGVGRVKILELKQCFILNPENPICYFEMGDQKIATQIQGGIANELYSEIVQSSNVELDRGSKTNENLHGKESDSGDLWYDDDDDDDGNETSNEHSIEKMNKGSDMEREWQMRHNQFHTIGYRDGLIAGKEAAAQEGFNIGFKNSVFAGYNWGLVRGITSAMACLPGGLKEKLVETEVARNKLNHLHETVQSLSTTDALKLFYEDQKRKSPNEKEIAKPSSTEAVSNHQDISVLENYHRQLESLISESPLLEGHLKVN